MNFSTPVTTGVTQGVTNLSLKSFWDDYSPHYSMLGNSPVFQQLVQDTLEQTGLVQGLRVLDLGCGPGYFLVPLLSRGAVVTAVDYSEQMLARAKRALSAAAFPQPRSKVEFVLADAPRYLRSTADGEFDIVIASLFLSYLPHPAALLAEVIRILKPGGRLVMSNPVPRPRFANVFWRSGWAAIRYLLSAFQLLKYAGRIKQLEKAGVFHFFDYEETKDMLMRAGFEPNSLAIKLSFAETVFLSAATKSAD